MLLLYPQMLNTEKAIRRGLELLEEIRDLLASIEARLGENIEEIEDVTAEAAEAAEARGARG